MKSIVSLIIIAGICLLSSCKSREAVEYTAESQEEIMMNSKLNVEAHAKERSRIGWTFAIDSVVFTLPYSPVYPDSATPLSTSDSLPSLTTHHRTATAYGVKAEGQMVREKEEAKNMAVEDTVEVASKEGAAAVKKPLETSLKGHSALRVVVVLIVLIVVYAYISRVMWKQ